MTLITACVFALVLAVIVLGYLNDRMYRQLNEVRDMLGNLALNHTKLEEKVEKNDSKFIDLYDELDEIRGNAVELEKKLDEKDDAERLEKALEKKWEDAIQTISNFDPFAQGEDK